MYHAIVNGKNNLEIDWNGKSAEGNLNGKSFKADVISEGLGKFHFILNNQSVGAEILEMDVPTKTARVKVNSTVYDVVLKDKFDDLLKSLGMESGSSLKVKDVKAPMPGMVISVVATVGQVVEKDTPLVILEAMKMENVIKSPAAGTVKRINAIQGNAVEKNTVLVEFE